MDGERINAIFLDKPGHQFRFVFFDHQIPMLMQLIGVYASDPATDFSWTDAAVVAQQANKLDRRCQ